MRLVNAKTQETVEPGAVIHTREGAACVFIRVEEDGAGSHHVYFRRDGERAHEYLRAHGFGCRVVD